MLNIDLSLYMYSILEENISRAFRILIKNKPEYTLAVMIDPVLDCCVGRVNIFN